MEQNIENEPGAIRLRSILLRMHREGQSDKQISDMLGVSEDFVSKTVEASRAGWLGEMSSALSTAWNFIQHRITWQG